MVSQPVVPVQRRGRQGVLYRANPDLHENSQRRVSLTRRFCSRATLVAPKGHRKKRRKAGRYSDAPEYMWQVSWFAHCGNWLGPICAQLSRGPACGYYCRERSLAPPARR